MGKVITAEYAEARVAEMKGDGKDIYHLGSFEEADRMGLPSLHKVKGLKHAGFGDFEGGCETCREDGRTYRHPHTCGEFYYSARFDYDGGRIYERTSL